MPRVLDWVEPSSCHPGFHNPGNRLSCQSLVQYVSVAVNPTEDRAIADRQQ
jgi:hypothetical protein